MKVTGYIERTVRRDVAEKSEISGLGDFDTEALRRLVHDFYREEKFPTLDTVLVASKEKGIFSGERDSLVW